MLPRAVSHTSFLDQTGFEVSLVVNRTLQEYDEEIDNENDKEEEEEEIFEEYE